MGNKDKLHKYNKVIVGNEENVINNNEKLNQFNKEQLNQMNGTIHEDDKYEWEDSILIDKILFKIKTISFYKANFKSDAIKELNELILKLSNNEIDYNFFIENEDKLYNKLNEEINTYNKNCKIDQKISIYSIYEREELLEIAKYKEKIFILGDGGVGKSYLLYKICKILMKNNEMFFVSFGKFDSQFSYEQIEDIINYSGDKKFFLIIDALNEYSAEGLEKIENFLNKAMENSNLKIVLSYRNHTLKEKNILFFEKMFDNVKYELEGVNIEYALDNMISQYGVEVLKYEAYIDFQNPLYLKVLKKEMENRKIKNETSNSFSQVTHLYESFIDECDNTGKLWNITKEIVAKYMYDNNTKLIPEDNLKEILNNDYEEYLFKMKQHGLLSTSNYNNQVNYVLNFDFFNDYLIARWFSKEISTKNKEEIVQIINEKINGNFSIREALIVTLFDNFTYDFEFIWDIINSSELKYYFSAEILKLIRFEKKENIIEFQKKLKFELDGLITNTLGVNNKPFNCKYYFNELFFKNEHLNLLSNYKGYSYNKEYFLKRLKFILALLARTNDNELIENQEIYDEYFYFSFWLMSSSYKDVRLLAQKCTFEFCRKNNSYFNFMIDNYKKISDDYIKDSIIEIICYSEKKIIDKYKDFLLNIYQDENELYSLKIIYIDNILFEGKRLYINQTKKNLILNLKLKELTENEMTLLFRIDAYEKDLLPWKVYKNPADDCSINLICEKKNKVYKINKLVQNKYKCLQKYSKNCKLTKDILFEIEKIKIDETLVDKNKIVCLYCEIIYNIAHKYDLNLSEFPKYGYNDFFSDSIYCKVVTIALHILEGTLMCNYYTNDFNINGYDNRSNLGYIPYNRYEYDDSFELNYYHPISKFNELADKLDEKLEEKITQDSEKCNGWGKNQTNIKQNLSEFIKTIKKCKSNWVLLAADIRYIYPDGDHGHKWMDNYIISSSYSSNKTLTGNNDRYITIECKKYNGAIEDYIDCNCDINMKYKSISDSSNYLPNNEMMLPPANLIKKFKLIYDSLDSTWKDNDGNVLIISNNNNKRFYKDITTKSLYINKKLFDEIKSKIKYYSFTTRSLREGYFDESEFHYEFDSEGNELKFYLNSEQRSDNGIVTCLSCDHNQIETEEEKEKEKRESQYQFLEYKKQIEECLLNMNDDLY